jgi:hypothetical protein
VEIHVSPLQSIRPQPAAPQNAADDARRSDLLRLLENWRALAARWVVADAHPSLAEPVELLDTLLAVERALLDRHPAAYAAVEPVLQLALLAADHADPGIASADCLICRRLADALPKTAALASLAGPR